MSRTSFDWGLFENVVIFVLPQDIRNFGALGLGKFANCAGSVTMSMHFVRFRIVFLAW